MQRLNGRVHDVPQVVPETKIGYVIEMAYEEQQGMLHICSEMVSQQELKI